MRAGKNVAAGAVAAGIRANKIVAEERRPADTIRIDIESPCNREQAEIRDRNEGATTPRRERPALAIAAGGEAIAANAAGIEFRIAADEDRAAGYRYRRATAHPIATDPGGLLPRSNRRNRGIAYDRDDPECVDRGRATAG